MLLHADAGGGLTWASVFTIDSGSNGTTLGDLQESYLPALGAGWTTQDLSKLFKVPTV